ncbi:Xanthine dehydrogenase 1 [Picochlorum sp. SENEW3]|nr:Xanthine dehydrogenase 1 [Picochlorum sp. SENEW3]
MRDLFCYVNGQRELLPSGRGECTLLEYLRDDLQLTGAKLGCGEGGCGACTVMVSRRNLYTGELEHRSINACLCPLYSVIGCHVVTVEGIGSTRKGLHPVQERIAKAHGSQCGFCTPGFVMSMYALLRSKNGEEITEEEIEENLAGNLCRCTGYRPILDAFRSFAGAYTNGVEGNACNGHEEGGRICPTTGRRCDCGNSKVGNGVDRVVCIKGDVITPPDMLSQDLHMADLRIMGDVASWYRPNSLESLLKLKREIPDGKIVAGNTEVGIEMKFKHAGYRDLIHIGGVRELLRVDIGDDRVVFGSSVSLTTLMNVSRRLEKERESLLFKAFAEQLKWFAGPPIRNWATIGGNVVTGSPISDINPLWIVSKSVFSVASLEGGVRDVAAKDFFLGYRAVDLAPDEILLHVTLPDSKPFEYVKEFKQAQRRDDDIAIVNCGIRVSFRHAAEKQAWVVEDCCIAYGGVAPVTAIAKKTAAYIIGKQLNMDTLNGALRVLKDELTIGDNAPGGRVGFRRSVMSSFLTKGLVHAASALKKDTSSMKYPYQSDVLDNDVRELAEYEFIRHPSKGIQYFSQSGEGDIVGTPVQHASAELQASGEAVYVDDIPKPVGTLHAALVLSEKAHAYIKSIDCSEAMALPGVISVHLAGDVFDNNIGPVIQDEELFASNLVTFVGQPLGIVTAKTRAEALNAARAVKVMYDELEPVLSIEDAIRCGSIFEGKGNSISRGDIEKIFDADSDDVVQVEGQVQLGGQEHFYLEPNAHLVMPTESGEILSYSSTQCPDKHQRYISKCLNIPSHKVVVKTKRIGGGFGGKETRAAFVNTAAAVASYHLNKPVSLVLDRDTDMSITGMRHPFMARYKAACTRDGKLLAVDVNLYSNAGNSLDLSASVMDRALLSLDNVYYIPHVRLIGTVCKTNLASNTAFRGFGGPQGMAVMENILDKLSQKASIDSHIMKSMNMYREGDETPYGMALNGCQARRCWEEAIQSAGGLDSRKKAIEDFNSTHKYTKRGIAVTPTKFGISFTLKMLNQAGALVHIYHGDGTILVSHGGVEMGQGLHTKVCQIVAQALSVPIEKVHISETSTDKVPNASPTAASASSDMYGAAAANACVQLLERLKPYKDMYPDATFNDIVQKAYADRVDLCAHGFYKTPQITGFGGHRPFNYLTYGVAVTEVELDTLTGNWHALRSDIVMDVGQSLNPAIDIGQIEGAFVQGMGWSCLEEVVWGDADHPWIARKGSLFTSGPGTYKIPTANDIPVDFRVSLLRNAPCEQTPLVHSSKAVGEPPFFLGTSVFWALKDAIYAYRRDVGITGWFNLDAPCTPERLRMACLLDQ